MRNNTLKKKTANKNDLLAKFRNRALCHWILNQTGTPNFNKIADFFYSIDLGDSNAWGKRASGRDDFTDEKLKLIERAYKNHLNTGYKKNSNDRSTPNNYLIQLKKLADIRSVYEIGPKLSNSNSIPFWHALSNKCNDLHSIYDLLLISFNWPAEVIKIHNASITKSINYLSKNTSLEWIDLPTELEPKSLKRICLNLNLNLPKFTNWHKLTLLIILYRFTLEESRRFANVNTEDLNLTYSNGLNSNLDDFDGDEIHLDDDIIESYYSFNSLLLTPIDLNYLTAQIKNQLVSMEEELFQYGFSIDELDFF